MLGFYKGRKFMGHLITFLLGKGTLKKFNFLKRMKQIKCNKNSRSRFLLRLGRDRKKFQFAFRNTFASHVMFLSKINAQNVSLSAVETNHMVTYFICSRMLLVRGQLLLLLAATIIARSHCARGNTQWTLQERGQDKVTGLNQRCW
jgi:hypothetical protein